MPEIDNEEVVEEVEELEEEEVDDEEAENQKVVDEYEGKKVDEDNEDEESDEEGDEEGDEEEPKEDEDKKEAKKIEAKLQKHIKGLEKRKNKLLETTESFETKLKDSKEENNKLKQAFLEDPIKAYKSLGLSADELLAILSDETDGEASKKAVETLKRISNLEQLKDEEEKYKSLKEERAKESEEEQHEKRMDIAEQTSSIIKQYYKVSSKLANSVAIDLVSEYNPDKDGDLSQYLENGIVEMLGEAKKPKKAKEEDDDEEEEEEEKPKKAKKVKKVVKAKTNAKIEELKARIKVEKDEEAKDELLDQLDTEEIALQM